MTSTAWILHGKIRCGHQRSVPANLAAAATARPSSVCARPVFGVGTMTKTDMGELKGKLEFELYGVGSDEGKTTPRLRHAYFELGEFLAGQTWSNFMDISGVP